MKKEAFMQICRSKAKEPLTTEQENFFGAIAQGIEDAFAQDSVERGKAIDGLAAKLGSVEEGESLATIVRALASKFDEVEKTSRKSFNAEEAYKLKRALEGKKTEIVRALQDRTQNFELEFKAKRAASAMMQTTTVLTGAAAINTDNVFDDMEVTVIRYPANFIGDAINSRQVSKVPFSIRWKEEVTAGTGAVTSVSEGTTKPLIDKKFEFKHAYRTKYAGRIEYTEETEIDFEQLTLQIIDMFEQDVLRAYNAGLLAAILAWAPAYAGTSLDGTIVKPTVMNAVSAGKLQLAKNDYMADTLVINPSDYAKTQNMQNVNGDPIFVPDNVLFPGLKLFVTNSIDAGTALLFEGGIIKEQHGSYIIRSGQYGNQLIENEKTIIGEIFSVIKLPTESKKGAVKLVISDVEAALLFNPNAPVVEP
jgi:hypothetical protein